MKRDKIKISLELQFASKWHAGSGESSFLTDRLINKDAKGRPFIPASTLKGVVRENCEKLSRTMDFSEWFSGPVDPHSLDLKGFLPLNRLSSPVDHLFGTRYQGGNLYFRDARLKDDPPYHATTVQSRISTYRILGTARTNHLFATEYAAPMTFKTEIEGYHQNLCCLGDGDPPFAYCLLVAGLLATDRIGGDKSTGKGNVGVHIHSIECNDRAMEAEKFFEYLDKEIVRLYIEETA